MGHGLWVGSKPAQFLTSPTRPHWVLQSEVAPLNLLSNSLFIQKMECET